MARLTLIAVILLASCGAPPSVGPELPEELASWWKLEEKTALDPEAAPEVLRELGVTAGVRVVYEGHPRFEATIFGMRNAGSAFEARQTWRAGVGQAAFHKNKWFVVVNTAGASRQDADRFMNALEAAIR
jgi:hypothetical protein